MIKFVFRRLLGMIPVLWIIITLVFFMIRLAPGGPFDVLRAKLALEPSVYGGKRRTPA